MTNSEIKKRLPKIFTIEINSFQDYKKISDKLYELYGNEYNFECLTEKNYYILWEDISKRKGKFCVFVRKDMMFVISYIETCPCLSIQDFLKYFEEDYSDEFEYIKLSQYEKGLLKISINKFVQHCENFGEELLNFDLDNYGKILGKL